MDPEATDTKTNAEEGVPTGDGRHASTIRSACKGLDDDADADDDDDDDDDSPMCIIPCPHCHADIMVARDDIACGIFRHGVYVAPPNEPLCPHASKEICDRAVELGLIYGCGKPFRFDGRTVTKCDYI